MILLYAFEISGIKVKVCFSFFAVVCLTCLLGADSGKVLIMLACCALHESGHLAAMLICSCKPSGMTFYGGGIKLIPCKKIKSFGREAFILASGCAVNFLLAFISCLLIGRLTFFAQVNLLLGGFNLLPVGYLDGGKIIDLVLAGKGARAVKCVFALLVALLASAAVFKGRVSVSLVCVLAYMCVSIFAS